MLHLICVSSTDFILWFSVINISPIINSFNATIWLLKKLNYFQKLLIGFGFPVSFICGVERSVIISGYLVGQSIYLYSDGGLLHLAKQLSFPVLTSVLLPAFS